MCTRLQVEKATGWIVQRGVPVPTVVRWLARDEPFKMRMLEGIDVEELSWWVAAKRFGFPQVRLILVLNPHGSFAGRRGCGHAIALKRGNVRAFGEAVQERQGDVRDAAHALVRRPGAEAHVLVPAAQLRQRHVRRRRGRGRSCHLTFLPPP